MTRTEKDKMLAGELYDASAPEIQAELRATHRWLTRYNATLDMDPSDRRKLLLERFAAVGEGAVIRPRSTATTASTSAWARTCS
jgi:maltose O-acetyltransferase